MHQASKVEPAQPHAPRRTDDRHSSLAVLLPAAPREPIVLAAGPELVAALRERFPRALVHGIHQIPDRIGLLVVDTDVVEAAVQTALRGAVDKDGVVATLGPGGDHVLYPGLRQPELMWRRGWPMPEVHGSRAQVRRCLGILLARWRRVPRVGVHGNTAPTLAEAIADDLGRSLGPVRLVGIVTAGQIILRFRPASRTALRHRRGRQDVAVRLSFDPDEAYLSVEDEVIKEVPSVARFLPVRVASGRTAGLPWVAHEWSPRWRMPLVPMSPRRHQVEAVTDLLISELERVPTGHTAPGWAADWLTRTPALPAGTVSLLTHCLAVLEDDLPSGWCHGDLWASNVLTGRAQGHVIDWDNADRDAPLGIDRVLVAALAAADRGDRSVTAACAHLVDDAAFTTPVAGRAWHDWDRTARTALAIVAGLLHLRNRTAGAIDPGELTAAVDVLEALALSNHPGNHPGSRPSNRPGNRPVDHRLEPVFGAATSRSPR